MTLSSKYKCKELPRGCNKGHAIMWWCACRRWWSCWGASFIAPNNTSPPSKSTPRFTFNVTCSRANLALWSLLWTLSESVTPLKHPKSRLLEWKHKHWLLGTTCDINMSHQNPTISIHSIEIGEKNTNYIMSECVSGIPRGISAQTVN